VAGFQAARAALFKEARWRKAPLLLLEGLCALPALRAALAERHTLLDLGPHAPRPEDLPAVGAALHGARLAGLTTGAGIEERLTRALGIRVHDRYDSDAFAPILTRNTALPAEQTRVVTTLVDDQQRVDIEIYEGNHERCVNNERIGRFTLHGLQRAPAGEPSIEVTQRIDASGLLEVEALDAVTRAHYRVSLDRS